MGNFCNQATPTPDDRASQAIMDNQQMDMSLNNYGSLQGSTAGLPSQGNSMEGNDQSTESEVRFKSTPSSPSGDPNGGSNTDGINNESLKAKVYLRAMLLFFFFLRMGIGVYNTDLTAEKIELCQKHWCKIVRVSIGCFIILVGFFQASCSVIRWVAIHECHLTNNVTNSSQDSYYKFTAALYGFFAILHALATLAIFIPFTDGDKWKHSCTVWKTTVTGLPRCLFWISFISFFIILGALSVAICVIGIRYDMHNAHCEYTHHFMVLICFYHSLVLITTLLISGTLLYLLLATKFVYHKWELEDSVRRPEYSEGTDELVKRVSLFYSESCSKYWKKGEQVKQFTLIFQSWFVLQWLIYFIGIFIDLTYVLRPWILGGNKGIKLYQHHKLEYVYIALFTVYDILVFIVPFACGLIMNNYHNRYHKNLIQKSLRDNKDEFSFLTDVRTDEKENRALMFALKTAVLKVQKIEEFDFTPSILGVDIPLTNPGYILSIVIAMVTLILGILVNPLNLDKS